MKRETGVATSERTLRLNLARRRPAATDESAWNITIRAFPTLFLKPVDQSITASHRNFAWPVHTDWVYFATLEWRELHARCISVGRVKGRLYY